ncbi:MAG: TRAP transporter small permease [Bacteroidota bacterium]
MKKLIDKSTEVVLIILMITLLFTVLWQVISRYLLNDPSAYTDELAGYLLIWMGLLGSAYVTGQKGHLAIDYFVLKMTAPNQTRVQIVVRVLIFLFSLIALVIGGLWLVFSRFNLEVTSAALSIPLGYIYLIIPVIGILICYYAISEILAITIKQKKL